MYANNMQLKVAVVDPNTLIVKAGRGSGKTEGVIGPRSVNVAADMPQETSVFAHKTYVALLSNVIPNLLSYYNSPRGESQEPLLKEGIDYVVAKKDLPSHFKRPKYPITSPEHTIVFANGHNFRLVATDQGESIAGSNIVHIFGEEMKHNKGDRFKTRLVPALRVGRLSKGSHDTVKSHYYGGITGVSDAAIVSLGEDSWFDEYEKNVDPQLIAEIVSLSLHIHKAMYNVYCGIDVAKNQRVIEKNAPILRAMRSNATLYIKASSFVNREALGPQFFKTQKEVLSISEFLASVCSISDRVTEDMFFPLYSEENHTFDDSYIYDSILKFNLNESFKLDSSYLKHYSPTEKLELGYDPGSFASLVASQENKKLNTLRILKEIFTFSPEDIPDLARKFNAFFSSRRNNHIDLYYDRAGNKKDARRSNETDAKELKSELEKYGWVVRLMNINQRTIYHWEHYKLFMRILSNAERIVPRLLIDSNECPNLHSAMYSCKKVPGSTPVELDKSSEKKLPLNMQAGLSPQIPSALMYLVFGKYERYLPSSEYYNYSPIPNNVCL